MPNKVDFTTIRTYRFLLVKLFFKNYFFIFFSLVNCILPLAITLLVACAHGTKVDPVNFVMVVGMVAAFMIPFYQLGFTFSSAILNLLSNMKKNDSSFIGVRQQYVIAQEYTGSALIGIIFSLMFCGISYAYITVGGNYRSTPELAQCGYDFIYVTSPTILISLVNSVTLFNIFYKLGNFRSTLIVVSELAINLGLVAVIGILTPQIGIYGFAIGLLLGCFVNFIILSIISWFLGIRITFKVTKDTKRHIWKIFRKMFWVSFSNVYFVFVRIVMVLAMGFAYKIQDDMVPNDFVIVKVIYFLILYGLTFIGSGASYVVNYLRSTYQRYPNVFNASYKTNWLIPFFVFWSTAVFSVVFYFSVHPMVNYFSLHSQMRYLSPNNLAYVGWYGQYGVKELMALPYNATLLLICLAMPFNAAVASMIIEPVGKRKKNKFMALWPQIIRPTITLVFIVGFGFGLFGHPPFQNMESFATAYLINWVLLFFLQVVQFSVWNKKFYENYKKINFVNILCEYLLIKNKHNFGKVVEYHVVTREYFHWPTIFSDAFKLKDHPYQKIRETIRNEMPQPAQEARRMAEPRPFQKIRDALKAEMPREAQVLANGNHSAEPSQSPQPVMVEQKNRS